MARRWDSPRVTAPFPPPLLIPLLLGAILVLARAQEPTAGPGQGQGQSLGSTGSLVLGNTPAQTPDTTPLTAQNPSVTAQSTVPEQGQATQDPAGTAVFVLVQPGQATQIHDGVNGVPADPTVADNATAGAVTAGGNTGAAVTDDVNAAAEAPAPYDDDVVLPPAEAPAADAMFADAPALDDVILANGPALDDVILADAPALNDVIGADSPEAAAAPVASLFAGTGGRFAGAQLVLPPPSEPITTIVEGSVKPSGSVTKESHLNHAHLASAGGASASFVTVSGDFTWCQACPGFPLSLLGTGTGTCGTNCTGACCTNTWRLTTGPALEYTGTCSIGCSAANGALRAQLKSVGMTLAALFLGAVFMAL